MTKNIVFIDSRVTGYESIIGGLGADTEWILLNAYQDGILQMERALKDYSALDAIHVISHGSMGTLYLGNTILSSFNLQGYSGALSNIGASLTDTGDLLLYGCDVAQEEVGQTFIGKLAKLTGADVAASVDATGSASAFGNWILEAGTGSLESATVAFPATYTAMLGANTAPTLTASGDGIVTSDIAAGDDYAYSVIVQPDGAIVVAGNATISSSADFAMVRYNTNGSLDTTFGISGRVTTDIGSGFDVGNSVTIQSDGKLVLAGFAIVNSRMVFAIVRYNSNGSMDTSFGNGGKVTTDFGLTSRGNSVTTQSDGKIVVGGYVAQSSTGDDLALVRYNIDGSLDSTFGTGGKVTTSIAGTDQIDSIKVQADGKIVVAGSALVRYNNDGSLDTSFGSGGKVGLIGFDSDVAIQSDGKIVVAGRADVVPYSDFALSRYNANGSLDTSFGAGGKVSTGIGPDHDYAQSLTIQTDGKIIVAGMASNGSNYDFALVRFNANGSLDSSFGTGGKVTTAIGSSNDYGKSVSLQADGKIVVAGYANGDFVVARYLSNGRLDPTFDASATGLHGSASYVENAPPIYLDSSVLVSDAELISLGSYSGASVTLFRHGGATSDDVFSAKGNLAPMAEGGVLVLSGIVIGAVVKNSGGTLELTFNSNATQDRVNETISSFGYANASENPQMLVQIDWVFSDGNTGSQGLGGAQIVSGYTTVSITAVNDIPAGTDVTITLAPASVHVLTLLDFGFNDSEDGTTMSAVRIDSLPSTGSLRYDGAPITVAGLIMTAADISDGHLSFQSPANPSGGSSQFQFSVRDSNDAFDLTANTLTFDFHVIAATDTLAPTVSSFAPFDEALDVQIGTNIVVTFSEAIQRGAGNVLLKTAGGTVVATYDAGTSTNLTISGSTLTIDPSVDLAFGTSYQVEFSPGTIKDLAGNPYAGTASYNFTTASGINTITGTAGNDLLQGTSDTDMIAGLGGIDTVQFSGAFGSFNLTKTAPAAWTVVGEGSDQLVAVERLHFSDKKIALDLAPSEHAGQALEFLGVMAPSLVHVPSIVGVVLGLIDGGLSMQGVFQLAIDIGLVNDIAGSNSNAAVAQMAFRNVIGTEADAGMTDLLVSFMDGRNANFSHADFLTVIAGMEINQVHIDLIGLQQTGIEFI